MTLEEKQAKRRAQNRAWLLKPGNRERRRQLNRQWRDRNKAASNAYKLAWQKAHPGRKYGLSNEQYDSLLGQFREDVSRLQGAIKYIEKHGVISCS